MSGSNQIYKENLLINIRFQAKQHGIKMRVVGENDNRNVRFHAKDGRTCVVWFPTASRIHDMEIQDLKEALKYITNDKAD